MSIKFQEETIKHYRLLKDGTVSQHAHMIGLHEMEPLIVAMDAMLRYAKAHKKAYGSDLSNDGVLGDYFLDTIKGLRGLLNGMGAVAMERNITTDSKDNGCVEGMFWDCVSNGGFEQHIS